MSHIKGEIVERCIKMIEMCDKLVSMTIRLLPGVIKIKISTWHRGEWRHTLTFYTRTSSSLFYLHFGSIRPPLKNLKHYFLCETWFNCFFLLLICFTVSLDTFNLTKCLSNAGYYYPIGCKFDSTVGCKDSLVYVKHELIVSFLCFIWHF